MELAEALEKLVARTKHERYRDFVNPAHEKYDPAWEAEIIRLAQNIPDPPDTQIMSDGPRYSLELALRLWWADSINYFRAVYWGASATPYDCGCGGRA